MLRLLHLELACKANLLELIIYTQYNYPLTCSLHDDILGTTQYFGSLKVLLSSLPLNQGGLVTSRTSDVFQYAFLSSCLDSLDLASCLLAYVVLPLTNAAVAVALTSAPDYMRSAYVKLIAGDSTSVASFHRLSTCNTSRGSGSRGCGAYRY